MQAITPYLNFNGNGAEALKFYEVALDGKIVHSQTFGESGMPIAEEGKDRIMHASNKACIILSLLSSATGIPLSPKVCECTIFPSRQLHRISKLRHRCR